MINRVDLEIRVKDCCPAELWYELLDTLEETPDSDLLKLITEHE